MNGYVTFPRAGRLLMWLAVCLGTTASAGEATGPVATPGMTFRECSPDCPLMIVIPSGSFLMGTDRLDIESDGREGPPHRVTFAKPFALGVYDVTRGEYSRFAQATGYQPEKGCHFQDPPGRWALDPQADWRHPGFKQTDRDPVVCVSWTDAQAYIAWLNGKAPVNDAAPQHYHLPSEAEWEYAARAGSTTSFYWGNQASHDRANYGIDDCAPCGAKQEGRDRWYFTSPVGSFPPNAFGIYDALGNIWQFTQDCMHYSFVGAPVDGSPWMTDTDRACYNRVLRGGSWLDPNFLLTMTVRNPWAPGDRNYANGFRVARTLE